MARATVHWTPTIPVPPPKIEKVVLELTETEARTLAVVTARISGSGDGRDATNAILRALAAQGIRYYDAGSQAIYSSVSGDLSFV